MITIDASVLVAAASPDDPAGPDAAAFIEAALTEGLAVHQPTLTLVEVSAAVARRTGDEGLAMEAGAALLSMPGLVLHPLDLEASADASASRRGSTCAPRCRLRGDRRSRQATTLVTLEGAPRQVGLSRRCRHAGWVARPPSAVSGDPTCMRR